MGLAPCWILSIGNTKMDTENIDVHLCAACGYDGGTKHERDLRIEKERSMERIHSLEKELEVEKERMKMTGKQRLAANLGFLLIVVAGTVGYTFAKNYKPDTVHVTEKHIQLDPIETVGSQMLEAYKHCHRQMYHDPKVAKDPCGNIMDSAAKLFGERFGYYEENGETNANK